MAAPTTKQIVLEEAAQNFGLKAVAPLDPSSVKKSVPEANSAKLPYIPPCLTQTDPVDVQGDENWAAIILGSRGNIPRWKPGTVLKWTAWRLGYASDENALYAAGQLWNACETWNGYQIGVTFQYVALAKDANFVLLHGGVNKTDKDTLAMAFFPSDNDMNYVFTYDPAFTGVWKENMWKIFMHELGHTLGLRHEFAIDKKNATQTFEPFGIQFGDRDPKSVMNYTGEPPEIQQSDIDNTKKFYSLDAGYEISNTKIKDFVPKR